MLRVYRDLDLLSAAIQGKTCITLGNFDGGHLGHQALLNLLLLEAKKNQLQDIVITFDPHPLFVLRDQGPALLMTVEQKIEFFRSQGVSTVLILPFTKELSQRTVEEFLMEDFLKKLKMATLCIGPTTHLGAKRKGTPQRIQELAFELSFDLCIASKVEFEGRTVHSSAIRSLIMAGEMEEAAQFLGRNYEVQGNVVRGDGRGRKLGFPTLNLEDVENLLPKSGVYATETRIENVLYPSISNIGLRPTFYEKGKFLLETHILEGAVDCANGERIVLKFLSRVRDEMKFASKEDLIEQIQKDVHWVREMHRRASAIGKTRTAEPPQKKS